MKVISSISRTLRSTTVSHVLRSRRLEAETRKLVNLPARDFSLLPPTHATALRVAETHKHTAAATRRSFQTSSSSNKTAPPAKPGSIAFADCEQDAMLDLFDTFAKTDGNGLKYLDLDGVRELLKSVGERPDERTLRRLFKAADLDGNGVVELDEFLICADSILGDAPARIVLVVGGPGSGKGVLCKRLEEECNVVHLSSGDLLRDEVRRDTPLGRECQAIMERGELVSSAVIVTLMRRRMRDHPGKRVLLDGFPRSLENAHDLVELCGRPEIALHLCCDDTILMERIIGRGRKGQEMGEARADDNFDTALRRLRTYHKYHHTTIDFLREQHVPIVNLDCSGSPENVWGQLLAIGRLMRPAAKVGRPEDAPLDFPSAAVGGVS